MEDTIHGLQEPAKKEVELDSALSQLDQAADRLDTVTAQLETRLRRVSQQPADEVRPEQDPPLRALYVSEMAQVVSSVTVHIEKITARVTHALDRLEV